MLVDFGASWCGACKELEQKTFSDPRVVREGERFIPVRIDLSPGKADASKQQLLSSYQQRGCGARRCTCPQAGPVLKVAWSPPSARARAVP